MTTGWTDIVEIGNKGSSERVCQRNGSIWSGHRRHIPSGQIKHESVKLLERVYHGGGNVVGDLHCQGMFNKQQRPSRLPAGSSRSNTKPSTSNWIMSSLIPSSPPIAAQRQSPAARGRNAEDLITYCCVCFLPVASSARADETERNPLFWLTSCGHIVCGSHVFPGGGTDTNGPFE